MKTKRTWRLDEAADFFRVSESTIRRWAKEGKLEAVKVYNGTRITAESIEALYQGREPERGSHGDAI